MKLKPCASMGRLMHAMKLTDALRISRVLEEDENIIGVENGFVTRRKELDSSGLV